MSSTGAGSPTIGLFVGSVEDNYQSSIIQGAFEAARDAGARLVVFNGGALQARQDSPARSNLLYTLADQGNFDALVVSGSVSLFTDKLRFEAFCRGYAPIPVVTIGAQVPGLPFVVARNRDGMEELLDHLLDHHGYRNIAFIAGPLGQPESEARKAVYLEKLRAKGLEPPAGWVVHGDFTRESGFQAVEQLLIPGGLPFEGIVCACDLMALGAHQALSLRGYQVPRDVFLTGFDDTEESRFHNPTLTTVRQSPALQAQEAVKAALRLYRNSPGPLVTEIGASAVIRASCGCPPEVVSRSSSPGETFALGAGEFWLDRFRDAFTRALRTGESAPFHRDLEGLLEESSSSESEGFWNLAVDQVREELLTRDWSAAQLRTGEGFLHEARGQVTGFARRKAAVVRFQTEVLSGRKDACGESLMFSPDLPSIVRNLEHYLPQLGCQGAWLSVYDNPQIPGAGVVQPLVFDLKSPGSTQGQGSRFPTRDLVPGTLRSLDPRHGLVIVEALASGEMNLGYLLVSTTLEGLKVSGFLRSQVSRALERVILQEERERTGRQLVQSEKMAALGSLVAGVSHEINTPLGVSLSAASYLRTLTRDFQTKLAGPLRKSELDAFVAGVDETCDLLTVNLGRAVGLVSSFKQVAADQTSEVRRTFALKEYLEEILISLGPQWKTRPIKLAIAGPTGIQVETYPGVVAQVVTNLLVNALVHAFPADRAGTIRIEVETRDSEALFRFIDDGEGIPPENLPRIFDPFFTTKRGQGGTGLGLHIVYNLVTQALGGSITCESTPDHGARFEVSFPLVGPIRG